MYPVPDDNIQTVELFAGPGGWGEGARILGEDLASEGLEISRDAVTTARAAGHRRRHTDVRDVAVAEYAGATGLIASPPCPTFSASGLRSGLADYQQVLDVWTSIGWGIDPDEAMTCVANIGDPRTALLATAGVWALGLPNLEWLAMEQVPAVEFAWEDLAAELFSIGWEYVTVHTVDAKDYGLPSRRRRTYLFANRTMPGSFPVRAGTPTTMADALGWPAGHRMITRGSRRPTGGNAFHTDQPSWCLTGKARSWTRDDGERLTPAQAGVLNGFRADYPWSGSRTSAFQQIGDVVSPVMAAYVLDAALGLYRENRNDVWREAA